MKKHLISAVALVALLGGSLGTQAQSVVYNFQDGTSDGWADSGFGSTPASTVASIGGQNYIYVPIGGFQVANVSSGAGSAFYSAMQAAAADPAGYDISYDYYINTAAMASPGTYLQVGTFVNTGSGYYAQDYGSPDELQLSGAQLASGQVFSGQVTINVAAVGYDMPPGDTFFRLGFIENGDASGSGAGVYFTDISVTPIVPEPSSMALLGMGAVAMLKFARRRTA